MPVSLGTTTITALYLGTTSIVNAYLGATQVFGGASVFTPLDLFSTGAQGIWLDPSDLSTMFLDRAGTTPVVTPGTVVGKRLDKSGRGNHATAPTDAARPIYGVEPKGGRRNLLTYSEAFNESVWTKQGTTVTTNATTAPDGTSTAEKLIETATTSAHRAYRAITVENSTPHTTSIYAKAGERSWVSLAGTTATRAWFDLATGVVGTVSATLTASIESVGDGWYRCSVTQTTYVVSGYFDVGVASADNAYSYTGDGTSGVYIWGAQLELGSTATAYQRVTTAYDVTESGVDTCHYVQYDGSDDSMSTAAIDFTGTDKMSVFAGVRKLTNSGNYSVIAEISSASFSSNGAFGLFTSSTSATGYVVGVRASAMYDKQTAPYSAPISSVMTMTSDFAGTTSAQSALRIDGVSQSLTVIAGTSAGTGNYGNHSLFFGRRNNASLPFNGRDYGIIVVGKAASAGEITDTETWLAAKTAQVTL